MVCRPRPFRQGSIRLSCGRRRMRLEQSLRLLTGCLSVQGLLCPMPFSTLRRRVLSVSQAFGVGTVSYLRRQLQLSVSTWFSSNFLEPLRLQLRWDCLSKTGRRPSELWESVIVLLRLAIVKQPLAFDVTRLL